MSYNKRMAIKETRSGDNAGLAFTGIDRDVLDSLVEKYNFKDAASAISYAIAVLLAAEDNIIRIRRDGEVIPVEPRDSLVKKKSATKSKTKKKVKKDGGN